MKLQHVLDGLRTIAPESLAENWDHVGLQAGDPKQDVRRGLLCIDLTPAVLDEARRKRAELIVTYHPPIFAPLTAVTPEAWKQRVIYEAVRHGIAIYAPHTALDAAAGGVNDWLCDQLGAGPRRPIRRGTSATPGPVKLATFVPVAQADGLRRALAEAGAGVIGDYRECAFQIVGEGTFVGGATTHPKVGRCGRLERVTEARLEMVTPTGKLADVVAALRRHHPYEEPAFDLYPLLPHTEEADDAALVGAGRVLTLDQPVRLGVLMERLRQGLRVAQVELALARGAKLGTKVRTLGVCAGAGGSLRAEAGAVDVFITGEMRHHDVLDAVESGMSVMLAGHTQTERPYLPTYRRRIQKTLGTGVTWMISAQDRAPGRGC